MEEEIEIWKDVLNYDGRYKISSIGNVSSFKVGLLKKHDRGGYLRVCLQKDKIKSWKSIHRLVAEAFIPNPDNKPQVNHKNGIKTDNRFENLEWNTAKENVRHSILTGLKPVTTLTDEQKRNLGKRSREMNSKKVINILSGEVYDSLSDCAKNNGYKRSTLNHYILGTRVNPTNFRYLN